MTTKALHISTFQERAFWIAASMVAILAFSYCFLVRATIVAAVERQNIEIEASALNSSLGQLESRYLTLTTSALTLNKAQDLGLAPAQASQISYVTRANTAVLSLNTR